MHNFLCKINGIRIDLFLTFLLWWLHFNWLSDFGCNFGGFKLSLIFRTTIINIEKVMIGAGKKRSIEEEKERITISIAELRNFKLEL